MAIRIPCSVLLMVGLLSTFGCSQVVPRPKAAAGPSKAAIEAVNRADEAFAQGEYDTAIQYFEKAIKLDPKFGHPYHGRGAAFHRQGEFAKAIDSMTNAIRLEPENDVAVIDRGLAYWELGQAEQAIADYERAMRLNPKNDTAYNAIGWALATAPQDELRDGQRAVELATQGCAMTDWKNPYHLSTLAAAFAEKGDFEKALEWHKKAMALPDYPQDKMDRAKQRLELYEQGKPYREFKQQSVADSTPSLTEPTPMKTDWPFTDAPNTAVISLNRIMKGSNPILYVVHDADGDWQFLDGGDVSEEDAATVSLQNIVDHDPAIKSLADLPRGWAAERMAVGKEWRRFEK